MKVAIFCGASSGYSPDYQKMCKEVMEVFHQHKLGLVYGGGGIGLMGILADEQIKNHGEVIGVIPKRLFVKEVAHPNLTDLRVVESMHARKQLMYDLADAFLILPGGIGTMDEFFEILTWKQLNKHNKPIIIYNFKGFYNHLLDWLKHTTEEGFFKQQDMVLINIIGHHDELVSVLKGK